MSLIDRLNTEADLCKNEGADDIAALLWEAAQALETAQDHRAGSHTAQQDGQEGISAVLGAMQEAGVNGERQPLFLYELGAVTAFRADLVANWPEHNRKRMTQPLYPGPAGNGQAGGEVAPAGYFEALAENMKTWQPVEEEPPPAGRTLTDAHILAEFDRLQREDTEWAMTFDLHDFTAGARFAERFHGIAASTTTQPPEQPPTTEGEM